MIITKYLVLLTILLLTSCAIPQVKDGEVVLDKNTAILVTRLVNSNSYDKKKSFSVRLSYDDGIPMFVKDMSLFPDSIRYDVNEDNIKVIQVGAGKAWFSRIGFSTGGEHLFDPVRSYSATIDRVKTFTLEAGKINYIGDFIIDDQGMILKTHYLDNEFSTVNQARAKYPEMFKKYEYVKNTPSTN